VCRSKELLARRQRLARGRAQAFQRLYTSSKCYRAEKIVSSILLDKSALSVRFQHHPHVLENCWHM
jgi:hypothetical protein